MEIDAVSPAGRVLVKLGAEVDADLLGHLLEPFDAGSLGETPQPALAHFFRRLLGDLFEAFADGLLGELTDQASENLLDDGPRGGNRRGGGGGCRARGEHHRDPKADQLADQDAELDPDFDFRGFDVTAAFLDHLPDLVADGGQEVQGGLVATCDLLPRVLER